MANLDCQGSEANLFQCFYDGPNEHSCTHESDLVIRCHRPRWAGIRLTISDAGSRTSLKHLRVRRAGLLDYARLELMPGLQLDYYSSTVIDVEVCSQSLFSTEYFLPAVYLMMNSLPNPVLVFISPQPAGYHLRPEQAEYFLQCLHCCPPPFNMH